MVGLEFKAAQQSILDQQKIVDRMDRASRRALYRFGAFVRQRAKTSLRPRKAASPPGQPPSSHTGLIRDHILFAVEGTKNVVIGPMFLRRQSDTALSALEHGGTTTIMRHGRPKEITLAARPFMRPAFDKEIKRAPKLWQNTL
jgi:hypothetical protein